MHPKLAYPQALLLCILMLAVMSGCESMRYYTQAISGQLAILKHREPIETLIAAPDTPSQLRKQLQTVLALRKFAGDTLRLPVDGSYLSYADIRRPYALWNVFAAPEFSLEPKTWCYPVAGCVAYRGFFSEESAGRYAEELTGRGFDTFISGVAAYSTLGWFDDPVLNTFVYRDETKLATLIFHELAHQRLYVPNDTTYSESFATAVEREGLRRWFDARQDPGAYHRYLSDYQRHQAFIRLIMSHRDRLQSVYSRDIPPEEKRIEKRRVLSILQADYQDLKGSWDGYTGYDAWFRHPLNNAQIITVTAYHDLVPAFAALLQAVDSDLLSFYRECEEISERPRQERHGALRQFRIESERTVPLEDPD